MTTPGPDETRWLVVVNGGARRAAELQAELEVTVRSHGLDAQIARTTGTAELGGLVDAALTEGRTGFVAVGGDGTAHHLLNALPLGSADRRFRFAVIPAGTGSDFTRTFGQDGDVDAALGRLATGGRYPIDVGWIEGSFGRRWFLNAANAGIAAQSVVTAERLPRRIGATRYTAAFWMTLARFPGARVAIDIDHHRFDGEALNVVVANGQFFGGGLNVAPRATLVDGRFDVIVFSGARSNAFTVMPRLALGSHLTHRAVRRYVGASVHIDVPEQWPIEADGELLGTGPVTIGIAPAALDYVV